MTTAVVRDDGKVDVTFSVHRGAQLTVTITRAEAEAAATDPQAARRLLANWRQL